MSEKIKILPKEEQEKCNHEFVPGGKVNADEWQYVCRKCGFVA